MRHCTRGGSTCTPLRLPQWQLRAPLPLKASHRLRVKTSMRQNKCKSNAKYQAHSAFCPALSVYRLCSAYSGHAQNQQDTRKRTNHIACTQTYVYMWLREIVGAQGQCLFGTAKAHVTPYTNNNKVNRRKLRSAWATNFAAINFYLCLFPCHGHGHEPNLLDRLPGHQRKQTFSSCPVLQMQQPYAQE